MNLAMNLSGESRPTTAISRWRIVLKVCATTLGIACGAATWATCAANDTAIADRIADLIDARFAAPDHRHPSCWDDLHFRASALRRVYLDVVGRIPTAGEAQSFAQHGGSARLRELVLELSASAASADRMAAIMRDVWFPQTNLQEYRHLGRDTRRWIGLELRRRRPLNQVARDLIAVPFFIEERAGQPPRALIELNGHRPEQMASNATRSFLGVDLSCAQCHDHPFDRWSREQFWQTAAMFQRSADAKPVIQIPDSTVEISARLFTGDDDLEDWETHSHDGRSVFAHWLANPSNPYFARHCVNEVWRAYFGAPLTDSVSRASRSSASTPKERLLDHLAATWAAAGFDLRMLVRGIALSQTYQTYPTYPTSRTDLTRGSIRPGAGSRALNGEQLFDSLCIAAGQTILREDLDGPERIRQRDRFCQQFSQDSDAPSRSVTQALALMNGPYLHEFLTPSTNPTVQSLTEATFLSESDCVSALFWSMLGRPPRPSEVAKLERSGLMLPDTESRQRRYLKLFWLLANSVEFQTNH